VAFRIHTSVVLLTLVELQNYYALSVKFFHNLSLNTETLFAYFSLNDANHIPPITEILPLSIPSNSFFILLYSSPSLLCCPTAFALSVSQSHTHYLNSLIAFSFLLFFPNSLHTSFSHPWFFYARLTHCHCFFLYIFHLPNFHL
jgi:hypothetical protein